MRAEKSARYMSDLAGNYIVAPVRVVVPAIGFAVLYRLLFDAGGLGVIGLWSLMAAGLTLSQVADMGFSQLLSRELATATDARQHEFAWRDLRSVFRFYLLVGALLVAVAMIVGLVLGPRLPATMVGYDTSGIWVAALLLTVATPLTLVTRLLEATLAALHQAAFASVVQGACMVLVFVVAIGGTLAGWPLEALALGYTVGAAVQASILTHRVRTDRGPGGSLPVRESVARVRGMVKRGRGLYAASVALVVRDPVFRFMIAAVAGVPAAGVVDIAYKATSLIRNVVSVGATPLYPALSWSSKVGDWDHVKSLVSSSATVLVFLGASSLGVFTALSPTIYHTWLGSVPPGLVAATFLISLWHLWTLFGTPFWFLALAVSADRAAAVAIWLQIGLIGLLSVYGRANALDLNTTLSLWLLSTLPTQLLVYRLIEKRLGLFWKSVLDDWTLMFAVFSLLCFLSVVWLSQGGRVLFGSLALAAAFCLFGAILVGPRLVALRWSKQS